MLARMAELRPYPFSALVRRALSELETRDTIFDLPRRKLATPSDRHDLRAYHHGFVASSPLGPAAGPHTQMAQNIALAWLSGCRIIELKTVQIMDELEIARPCIDMQTVGYNVEWSQELRLPQSLEEYVKGAMLITILRASGQIAVADNDQVLFDMSVGYDLAGIRSPRVQAFIDGIRDCTSIVDRLRSEIPAEFKQYRDLDFPTRLSNTLTLSTFHGCPPEEIEKIIDFLLIDRGIHSTVKLNPTLLGAARVRELLGEKLGYTEIKVPTSAFEKDAKWQQAIDFCGRLGERAQGLGLGFGVKFSNTLIVDNHRDFFPASEAAMYLSGPPLHVLASELVGRFRGVFGDRFPISFSAGIDRHNFADAVALGLCPITTCSDLLKPGGYGRASAYTSDLQARMDRVGARDLPSYIIRAYDRGEVAFNTLGLATDDPLRLACLRALSEGGDLKAAAGEHFDDWVSAARLENTLVYVPACRADARYSQASNRKPPRKVGSSLALFDCLSCNKCVPVCPNDANFVLETPPREQTIVKLQPSAEGFVAREEGVLRLGKKTQYANFADFCNECGNCDIFCPEDGGPYIVKPRFFGSFGDFRTFSQLDGFYICSGGAEVHARIGGADYLLHLDLGGGLARFSGHGFDLHFDAEDPIHTVKGEAENEVDLTYFYIIRWIRDAVFAGDPIGYVRLLASSASSASSASTTSS